MAKVQNIKYYLKKKHRANIYLVLKVFSSVKFLEFIGLHSNVWFSTLTGIFKISPVFFFKCENFVWKKKTCQSWSVQEFKHFVYIKRLLLHLISLDTDDGKRVQEIQKCKEIVKDNFQKQCQVLRECKISFEKIK